MAPLRFSANVSWLFPELPGLPARLRAAGSSGFEAAEVAWPYAEQPEALARAAREAGLRLVLINTPPGDREKGEMGLGAVPGRQAAFREGLEQAVLYAKALGCPRVHLMAGRVPQGADRAAVRSEMETVFLENLRHAAGVLAQESLVGLLEPINTRITDPRGSPLTEGWKTQPPVTDGPIPLADHGWEPDRKHTGVPAPRCCWRMKATGALWAASTGLKLRRGHLPLSSGDTVEGLNWLRSYWDRQGRPQAGQ
ncbi:putative hydroxypyruvate isomerase isoform X3 [Zalophus californianus]|uniref:Hydroxypyruvate isomerase isoform X3 n=1 Tax=Zalophus californianus TaxID=9704 RepID=A0A6J2DVC0_ZALCA|nr:putative hydroxypyruvate isomerase isoform X3 [Zalophus californianus]